MRRERKLISTAKPSNAYPAHVESPAYYDLRERVAAHESSERLLDLIYADPVYRRLVGITRAQAKAFREYLRAQQHIADVRRQRKTGRVCA